TRVSALMSTPKASAPRRAASSPPLEPLAAAPRARAAREDAARPAPPAASLDGQYRLEIPAAGFEGPLDLLLHLIQQHELDILDIPVSFVTEKFLAYIQLMRSLSIDI